MISLHPIKDAASKYFAAWLIALQVGLYRPMVWLQHGARTARERQREHSFSVEEAPVYERLPLG